MKQKVIGKTAGAGAGAGTAGEAQAAPGAMINWCVQAGATQTQLGKELSQIKGASCFSGVNCISFINAS